MMVIIVVLITAAVPNALSQDATGPQLERVDVEPPERTARSRDARPGRLPAYDDATNLDQPSPDYETGLGGAYSGSQSLIPSSSLSVVTDKSSVSSVGSAALPAQVTVVSRREIDRLDVRNYTDLFRTVPGVRSYTYGQGDVGHPMQIRGNSGAHGVDTCIYVDGVPQNFPSASQGGNGMSDISWLSPEMIDRIEVIKGPFSVLYGNYAQAGVINIITKNSEPTPSMTLSGASFGGFRAVPIITSQAWVPTPFVVNDYQTLDGYAENSQYKRYSSFNKVTAPIWNGYLSLRVNYYKSDWGAPGFPYIDYVLKGIFDRRSAVNPTDLGYSRRWSAVANYAPSGTDAGLYFTAYVEKYEKYRWSTILPDPQRLQDDDRTFYGGRIFYNVVFGNFASMIIGAESRYDRGMAQQFKTVNRQTTGTTNDYGLGLANHSLFIQGQAKLADSLKLVGGVRKDYFDMDVTNRLIPASSGSGYPTTLSPKVGFVLTPLSGVNIFGNKGLGFRAPAASEMSPAKTTARSNFELQVAQTDSWDLGFNATFIDKVYIAFDWYRTDMENEVRTDATGTPYNVGNSQRTGYEVEAKYYASDQINIFANYSWVDAKVKNPTTVGQNLVTGVAQDVIKAGIELTYDLTPDVKFLGDLYCEYISQQPFYFGTDPTPQYGPDYVMYNMKMAWQGRNWSLFAAAKYQPKELSSDSVSSAGNKTVGYHFTFRPRPLWDLNGGLKYTF
jgi:outer membrane receptor protein involved in Fe transport